MTAPTRSVTSVFTPYRIAVSLLLAAAVVGIGWAFSEHREVEDIRVVDSAIVHLEPGAGDHALRQDRIYVELQPNFTGVLFVNDIEIPEDQLDRAAGPHTMGYTPSAEAETGALEPGVVRARVEYWDAKQTRQESRDFRWEFNVS